MTLARAENLGIGDPAPKLQVKEFLKGKPVEGLEKGKTYVVEFWATWCGPCKATIPHLTELQKQYKNVTFIGVSVYEQDPKAVKPFVDEMGSKMDYRVAVDSVPEKGDPGEGKMAKTWMDAAAQEGIPTAFIVNTDGKVAWIGHPGEMEKPLEQIVKGTWDMRLAAAKFKEDREEKLEVRALQKGWEEVKQEKLDAKLAFLDKALKEHARLEKYVSMVRFQLLKEKEPKEAAAYGTHLIATVLKDNPVGLNQLAWLVVDPDHKNPAPELLKTALAAAERADELSKKKDPAIADTLAAAYAAAGDMQKAVEAQERAVKLAKGTEQEQDKSLTEHLEKYRKALKN
jgi:thiol-disulfide isomerase/thioredoxin